MQDQSSASGVRFLPADYAVKASPESFSVVPQLVRIRMLLIAMD